MNPSEQDKMLTEKVIGESVADIKEQHSMTDLDFFIGRLSVSPKLYEETCFKADESSMSLVSPDVSGADILLPAFDSISFDVPSEQSDDVKKHIHEVDDINCTAHLSGNDAGKSEPADAVSISDPSNQRHAEGELVDGSDKLQHAGHPVIVYTSSQRRSSCNDELNQSNESRKTSRISMKITNRNSVVDVSSLQISRRRRSLFSKRTRSSIWGSVGNILPSIGEVSGANTKTCKEKKTKRKAVQRNRNAIRDQYDEKATGKGCTPAGRISLKIKFGNQSCVVGNAVESLKTPGKIIPESHDSVENKVHKELPTDITFPCERNAEKVTSSDDSVLSRHLDVMRVSGNPGNNNSSYHHQVLSQVGGENLGGFSENRSYPGTSPDSEVINSVPDLPHDEKALPNLQDSTTIGKSCVSVGHVSSSSLPEMKSKNQKLKDKDNSSLASILTGAELSNEVRVPAEIGLVPCGSKKKVPKCSTGKAGSKNRSVVLDLPGKKDKASKKKGSKKNVGGKHQVNEAIDTSDVREGVEGHLAIGNLTSSDLGDSGALSKELSGAMNSLQFSSSGKKDQFVPLRNAWVLCDECQKWRRIPAALADEIEETNCGWTCKDNTDKDFDDCSIAQEKSNSEINEELEISDEDACDNLFTTEKNRSTVTQKSSWSHIRSNMFLHRNRKKQAIDEVMVCHCKPPSDGRMGCGAKCLNRILNIECVKGTCPCGDLCSNQQFQKRKYANLKCFKCGKKGYGLQADEYISAGQFLIEYVGEVLDMHAYEARQRQYAVNGHKHFYFMTLNGSEVIDACAKGNLGRFINHSCNPNCRTEKWMVNGEVCVGLFALRDIKQGEEVTFDYNYVRVFGAAAKKCVCGSPNCRGYIGGDPTNSEIIVQDDSDDEFPEPVMICEDNETKLDWDDIASDSLNNRDKQIAIEPPEISDMMMERDSDVGHLGRAEEHTMGYFTKKVGVNSASYDGREKTSADAYVVETAGGDKFEDKESIGNNSAATAVGQLNIDLITGKCTVESESLLSRRHSSSQPMDIPPQPSDIKTIISSDPHEVSSRQKAATISLIAAHGSEMTTIVSPIKSLPYTVECKTKGKDEPANPLAKTRRPSSIKKGKIKSNVSSGKGAANVDQLNAGPNKFKKQPEYSINSQFEAVEEKLNDLLEPGGGISKRKDASRGYLKLLFLTAASGNNGHGEAIQSNRELSMILDALLKTKSRTVLVDIINKNGLQMLHNILKRYRKEFIKTPILRKLLKVIEYLAMREILTLEHITGGPPRPGAESFKDSILTLTEHADKQVHQIARNFRDRWIPRSHRKKGCKGRDDRRIESHPHSSYGRPSVSHDHSSDRDGKPSESTVSCETQTAAALGTTETPIVDHSASGSNSGTNEIKPRKRKSRWDTPPEESPYSRLKTAVIPNIDDDVPPGFSVPCNGPMFPLDNSSTAVNHLERNNTNRPSNVMLGYSQQRFIASIPLSYGIPSSVMQQFGVGTSMGWKVAPGLPFYPFPPLPSYDKKNYPPSDARCGSANEAAENVDHTGDTCTTHYAGRKHARTWSVDPAEMDVSVANDWPDFQQGGSHNLGRKYFRQQKSNHSKLAPPWVRMRNGWGFSGNNVRNAGPGAGLGNGLNEFRN